VSHQGEGALAGQVQRPLQSRKEGQKGVPQTADGPGLIGDEIPATGKQKLQLGELSFAGSEPSEEVGPHPGLG
jgi:hypothetical protein